MAVEMVLTRREWLTGLALPAAGMAARAGSQGGVEIGVQSFSFKDLPFDAMLDACERAGIRSLEIWSGHIERPWAERGRPGGRERLRQWRIAEGPFACARAREELARRNLRLNAFNLSIRNEFTDEEIDAAFRMAQAFGTDILTTSSNVSTAARIDPFAKERKVRVGFHNHARIHEDEFATPEDFAKATEGYSEWLGVNLDVGHYHAAGFDCVEFLRRNHARTWALHMKDRRSQDGPKVAFGAGDAPLAAVMTILRDEGWPIPANIEMAYPTGDPVAEVAAGRRYLERALARAT
ncbi:MAG: TIM barrel protein [Acidobacteria bacterium]|nr:TIM barrel protein [Acidobacteriota bacterium]